MFRLVFATIIFAAIATKAGNEVAVPFTKYSKKITLTPTLGPCSVDPKNKFTVETEVAENSYRVQCNVVDEKGAFHSSVPVTALENFKQKIIINDIKSHAPESVRRRGMKAIHSVTWPWGVQYWWSNEAEGTTFYSYLCPKKEKTCYRVIYGGNQMFNFDITPI